MAVTRASATGQVTASQRRWANGGAVTCDIEGACCHCCACDACDGCYSQGTRHLRTVVEARGRGLAAAAGRGDDYMSTVTRLVDLTQVEIPPSCLRFMNGSGRLTPACGSGRATT